MTDRSLEILARVRGAGPRICHAAGRPLPGGLLHEGLPCEGGRVPETGPHAESVDALVVDWTERHPDRRSAGIYLTPPGLARSLLEQAASGHARPRTILDPAVGAGVFLLQAREIFGAGVELHGADIDPAAVAITRLALWLAGEDGSALASRIVLADALVHDWRSFHPDGFDLVCGNPPFGNAIEHRTGRSDEESRRLRDRFGDRLTGPFDRSVPFVLLGAELLSRSGRYAWILPRALLSARYAARLREWLDCAAPLDRLVQFDESGVIPEVGIPMAGWIGSTAARTEIEVVGVDGRSRRSIPRSRLCPRTWGALIDPLGGLAEIGTSSRRFGELFEVRASMAVGEAYRAAAELRHGDAAGAGWRLLTAGSLTRYGDTWAERATRVLGRRLLRPILPRETATVGETRKRQFDSPKVIVAGLSRVLKARFDHDGSCAGSVGTLTVLPRAKGEISRIHLIAAAILLNSAWLTEIHRLRTGPAGLAGGGLSLLKRDLEEMPLPDEAALENLAAIDIDAIRDAAARDEEAQQTILRCAGFGQFDAERLIAAWRSKLPAGA